MQTNKLITYSSQIQKKFWKFIVQCNQITHSNNKIKATWNTIKSETGGNNIKCDKANVYNTDKEYSKSVKAEVFNKYFLTIAESISYTIMGNNNNNQISIVLNTHCLIYLRYLIFHLPILFFIIHLRGKLKKLFTPSLGKTRVVMMKFQ